MVGSEDACLRFVHGMGGRWWGKGWQESDGGGPHERRADLGVAEERRCESRVFARDVSPSHPGPPPFPLAGIKNWRAGG